MTTGDDTPRTGLRGWVSEIRASWWIYPLAALFLTVISTPLSPERWRQVLVQFAINGSIAACIGLSVTAIYVFVVHRLPFYEGRWFWPINALALAMAVAAGTEIALALLIPFFDGWDPTAVRRTIWQIGGGVGAVIMLGSIGYEHLRDRIRAEELRKERAEKELLVARVENLRSTLNPHFLFNSLNTVATLIEEDGPSAVAAVEELSDLLRYALEGGREQFVPLRREVEAVERYVGIEQRRFGSRLRWAIDVDGDALDDQVPVLLLQPAVENAIKHGVAMRREGATVHVGIAVAGDHLRVTVENDGPGDSSASGTNIGEANLRQRLDLMYGEEASFKAGPRPQGGYRVEISLPRTAGGPT